jgi:hypothetical protein
MGTEHSNEHSDLTLYTQLQCQTMSLCIYNMMFLVFFPFSLSVVLLQQCYTDSAALAAGSLRALTARVAAPLLYCGYCCR